MRAVFLLLWWVFALLPSYQPRGEEFTTTDFPAAVAMARRILSAPDANTADVAAQMTGRPAWQRGRSLNPNRCAACGYHADWHVFDTIVTCVYHDKGWIYAAAGRVPVSEWRAIRGRGQGIYWPYC